jgi:geranylgeranyl diphosphate synthase type I
MLFETYLKENVRSFDAYLDTYFTGKSTHPDFEKYLYGPLAAYTANGGKRHRPLICALACEAVGGERGACLSAAAAIEHFHTAALIHDDIADDAKIRRGKPCLHISMGDGLAINAGDLSLSLVTGSVIDDMSLPESVRLRVVKELIEMTARTVEGQALDLGWARDERFDITVEDYITMATHKTAYYSGGVPLAIGAIIGGGTEEQIELLREFGMKTGLAFQIQDDILNIIEHEAIAGKDYRSDLYEGKRTLMVVHALNNSDEVDFLKETLSTDHPSREMVDRAAEILIECGSVEYAHEYAEHLTATAKDQLVSSIEPSPARDLLLSMADFFVERMQ